MFLRKKKIKGKIYYYAIEVIQGKQKQKYLGTAEEIVAAVEFKKIQKENRKKEEAMY